MSRLHCNVSSPYTQAAQAHCARLLAERYSIERRIDALYAQARAGGVDWREVQRLHAVLDDSVLRGVWTYREVWLEFLRGRLDACADASANAWDVLALGVLALGVDHG